MQHSIRRAQTIPALQSWGADGDDGVERGGSRTNKASMLGGVQHGTLARSAGTAGTSGADCRDKASAQSFNSLGKCPTASRSPQRAWRRASSRQTLPRSPRPRWDTATVSAAKLSPTSAALCNRPGPHHVVTAARAVRASKKGRYFDSPIFTLRPSQRPGVHCKTRHSTGLRPAKRTAPPPHTEASKSKASHCPGTS